VVPVPRYFIHLLTTGLLLAALFSGCSSVATHRAFYEPVVASVSAGDFDMAVAKLEKARESGKYSEKDRLIYFIDAGVANHYAGNYDVSNDKLHLAEAAAEELYTKSISRTAATMLLNDNVLEYTGEDYEELYTNLIKALNYIALNQFDGAFVEIRRAHDKLQLLEQKHADAAELFREGLSKDTAIAHTDYEPKHVKFYNDAFARYLSMHMYAAEGKYDDARIDYDFLKKAFVTQPYIYDFVMPEVKYYTDDGVILSVVALTGLAPRKEALNLRIRTDKDLDLVQVLYTDSENEDSEYGHLPMKVKEDYYFKFAIPRLVARPSIVSRIRVLNGIDEIGELQLLEDVSTVAKETFEARKSMIYFRTVLRAVAKGLAAHKAKKKADTGGLGGWLKKAAIDVTTDLSENADLRSSQLLPGRIYVGDFELQPGRYDLTVEFYTEGGQLIVSRHFPEYRVLSKGLNLIQAVLPN
jgi:hypothetical protein